MVFKKLDEERAMSSVYRVAEFVCSCTKEEWDILDAPPHRLLLDAKASEKIGGVVIHFGSRGGEGRDGRLEIECVAGGFSWERKKPRIKRIVFTCKEFN